MEATIKTEHKGDYVREIEGALRKTEGSVRQLQADKVFLTDEVRRLKRTVTTQASEIARLKAL